MNTLITKSHSSRPNILLPLIIGILLGVLSLMFMRMPTRWFILCFIGMIIPFLAMLLGNAKKFFLAILVIALPLNLDITIQHSGHLGGAAGFMISLFDITLVVLYVFWCIDLMSDENARINYFPKISVPTLLLIGIAFLSMINAYSLELCLFQIIEMLKMYLCFLYLANNIKNKKEVQFIIVFLVLGIFIESLLVFFQYYFDRSFNLTILGGEEKLLRMETDDGTTLSRVSGTFGSPNYFARYLNFLLPLILSISFFEQQKIYRRLYYLVLSVGIVALTFTFSRGGWFSFLLSLTVVLSLILWWKKRGTGESRIVLRIIVVVIILATVLFSFSSLITSRISSDDRGSALSRLYLMKIAFSMIETHPVSGVGINNYMEVMHNYDTTTISDSSFSYKVHNIYLQIAAEMGVVALAVFLWIIILFYKEALSYIKYNNGIFVGIVIGIIGGCTTFLAQGLIDSSTLGNILFKIFWFFLGFIFAIKNISIESQSA